MPAVEAGRSGRPFVEVGTARPYRCEACLNRFYRFTWPWAGPWQKEKFHARRWASRIWIGSLTIYYQPFLHRLFGLDWIIGKMPMQKQVRNAVQVMEIYRRRPVLVLLALIVTFPVHVAVIVSALCAGKAFGLPLDGSYYFAVVPVIVLSGALPGPPQGAGVMEYFAIRLTETRGATISQAFALTMSIRLVQVLWNLTGAYFVIRGHFHAPTADEQKEVESAGGGEAQA